MTDTPQEPVRLTEEARAILMKGGEEAVEMMLGVLRDKQWIRSEQQRLFAEIEAVGIKLDQISRVNETLRDSLTTVEQKSIKRGAGLNQARQLLEFARGTLENIPAEAGSERITETINIINNY